MARWSKKNWNYRCRNDESNGNGNRNGANRYVMAFLECSWHNTLTTLEIIPMESLGLKSRLSVADASFEFGI